MNELQNGDAVILHARVNHVLNPSAAPAYQQVSLQLRDGAGLITSVVNIERNEPEGAEVEAKAIDAPPANKAVTTKKTKGR